MTDYTAEEIRKAAAILEHLVGTDANVALDEPTYFCTTATHLNKLAYKQEKAEKFVPTVRVGEGGGSTAVYIEKPDGDHLAVYVNKNYADGFNIISSLSPDVAESRTKVVYP